MDQWIAILVAFVHNDTTYDFGTKFIHEMKVATTMGNIEIQNDTRWDEMLFLSDVFAGEV
jgi:hypothetical protein